MGYEVNVSVKDFAKALNLDVVVDGKGHVKIASDNISRLGLPLTGYFNHFDNKRIQVVGLVESEYIYGMERERAIEVFKELFSKDIPCLIITRGLTLPGEIISLAKEFYCPVFSSKEITTQMVNRGYSYVSRLIAPETMRHGVLLDVSGVGILIEGNAGIGKSEIALELINRGHRLVADDCVIIRLVNGELIGSAPEMIRNYMEIRGLGIVNIQTMYGPGSVLQEKNIDIVVQLERWDVNKKYDRIGDEQMTETILDMERFKLLMPVSPGRNIPTIIETAARKFRLKQGGYDAAQELLNKTLK